MPPRFPNVSCSQCGRDLGPGEHGFSHCENHAHLTRGRVHPDNPPPPPADIWRGLMQDAAEAQIPTRREAEETCDLAIEVWRLFGFLRATTIAARRVKEERN